MWIFSAPTLCEAVSVEKSYPEIENSERFSIAGHKRFIYFFVCQLQVRIRFVSYLQTLRLHTKSFGATRPQVSYVANVNPLCLFIIQTTWPRLCTGDAIGRLYCPKCTGCSPYRLPKDFRDILSGPESMLWRILISLVQQKVHKHGGCSYSAPRIIRIPWKEICWEHSELFTELMSPVICVIAAMFLAFRGEYGNGLWGHNKNSEGEALLQPAHISMCHFWPAF